MPPQRRLITLNSGARAPTLVRSAAETDTVELIIKANGQLPAAVPIRIDMNMFCAEEQTSPVLRRLVQFYHNVSGNLTRREQARYLAMLHSPEWECKEYYREGPLKHDVMRSMVSEGANGELVFYADEMSLNKLAIMVASYPRKITKMRNLGMFSAFEQVQIGYTSCPEVYRRHWTTGLYPWVPTDAGKHSKLGPVAVVKPTRMGDCWSLPSGDEAQQPIDEEMVVQAAPMSTTANPTEPVSYYPTPDTSITSSRSPTYEPQVHNSEDKTDGMSFLRELGGASAAVEAYADNLLQKQEKQFREERERMQQEREEERQIIVQIFEHVQESRTELAEAWTKLGQLLRK